MKACIASLRAEIAELRTAFQEVEAAVAAKDSEARSVSGAHLEGWSQVSHGRQKKGKQSNSMKSNTAESGREQPNTTTTAASFRVDKSRSQQCPTGRSKVEVKGKRKVWGMLKTTTVAAMKNAIKVVSKVEGLEIKRKYSLKKAQQARIGREAASIQVSKWWFVISGEESILDQLARNWDAVKLQTNWSLKPIFSYGNPTDQAILEYAARQDRFWVSCTGNFIWILLLDTLKQLYLSLVRPHLEYAAQLYGTPMHRRTSTSWKVSKSLP